MFKFIPLKKTQANIALTKKQRDKYQYSGYKYGLRGTAHYGPDDYIPQERSLYAFPKEDGEDDQLNTLNPTC